ncbi:hypothetical protein [Pseudomonas atacamensis]|uniref:hypothetical protein n=1 Tax=Pseudomonas atacamensis TaxID=2565368 RepID=UPI00300E71B2
MDKASLAVSIISAVVAYFSMSDDRRIDLKIFAMWCSLCVLMFSHIQSFYKAATQTGAYDLERAVVLNATAIGVLVLLAIAFFFKKYLRASLQAQIAANKKPGTMAGFDG